MTYANQLRVFVAGGAVPNPPTVTADIWRLTTTIDDDGAAVDHDINMEVQVATTAVLDHLFNQANLSFIQGPSYLLPGDASNKIALTVADPRFPGFIFRSGALDSLPVGSPADPNGFIQVIEPEPVPLPLAAAAATVNATLPTPIPNVPGAVLRAITLTPGNGVLTVVATGTVPGGVTFTYTLNVGLVPSLSVRNTREVFRAVPTGTPGLTFAGGTVTALVEAAVLNFLSPLIADQTLDTVIERITTEVNSAAVAAAAALVLPGAPAAARSGTVISAQSVMLRAAGISETLVAVANFGTVFPPGPTSGTSCALTQASLLLSGGLQLDSFRYFRDQLAQSVFGRQCIELYYAHGADVWERILRDPRLTKTALCLAKDLETELEQRRTLSAGIFCRVAGLLWTVVANGPAGVDPFQGINSY